MLKKLVASLVVIGLAILAAMTTLSRPAQDAEEWINPGGPLAPKSYIETEWFKRGDSSAIEGRSIGEIRSEAGFKFVARAEDPDKALVQPQQLVFGSKSFSGYTLKYSDRIQLIVNPTDEPLDLEERLRTTDMTTTAGETKLWSKVSLRGTDGAYRRPAVQKWASGDVNEMPAVLEWTEPSGDGLYVQYALLGDASLGELMRIAQSLK